MTLEKAIRDGRIKDALLGEGDCFVQSRYLSGHDHLLALFWLNKVAVSMDSAADAARAVECIFERLVHNGQPEEAANFITAIDAAMQEKDWAIPVDFSTLAHLFSPLMDKINLSEEFHKRLKSFQGR